MASRETVAVLGAGATMGFPMARNLARSGISVRAWNRTREKAEPLAQDGAQVCDRPAEAAEGASVILTMLADADAVIDVVAQAGGRLLRRPAGHRFGDGQPGHLAADEHDRRGGHRALRGARRRSTRSPFVDAPVLGHQGSRPSRASSSCSPSGPATLRDPPWTQIFRRGRAEDALGRSRRATGTRLKLVVNNWVLTVTEGAAETIALAEGLGLDPAAVLRGHRRRPARPARTCG